MVRCRMLVKWLDGSPPHACLTAGRFSTACLFSGWTVCCRIQKKIIRTPDFVSGFVLFTNGKPAQNRYVFYFEEQILTIAKF